MQREADVYREGSRRREQQTERGGGEGRERESERVMVFRQWLLAFPHSRP